MRTYDKLIATICSGQGNGGLRSSSGLTLATLAYAGVAAQVTEWLE